jgi:hypothetical protein
MKAGTDGVLLVPIHLQTTRVPYYVSRVSVGLTDFFGEDVDVVWRPGELSRPAYLRRVVTREINRGAEAPQRQTSRRGQGQRPYSGAANVVSTFRCATGEDGCA